MTGQVLEITKAKKRKRSSICGCRRKRIKQETFVPIKTECCFCHEGENPELGVFFQDKDMSIAVHQYCLFFSAGLPQRGGDEEGFDGFLLKDLYREAVRANKIECKYCSKFGANSGCSVKSCRTLYHYNCGRKDGAQFKFTGAFDSYCTQHRTYQDLETIKTLKMHPICPVCLEDIRVPDHDTILKTPCCKNVFMHRGCIQIQASVSGYFFRCPTCNNEKLFTEEMSRYGIYVPLRDAAWEESNAFAELLEQYNKCDLKKCKCRRGRKYNTQAGKWHVLRCYACGQSGVHVACLGNQYIPGFGYICSDCNKVIRLAKSNLIVQATFQERWIEHKRLLQELRARDDPVLLASPVFGAQIWMKRFKVKPCRVYVEKMSLKDVMEKKNTKQMSIANETEKSEQKKRKRTGGRKRSRKTLYYSKKKRKSAQMVFEDITNTDNVFKKAVCLREATNTIAREKANPTGKGFKITPCNNIVVNASMCKNENKEGIETTLLTPLSDVNQTFDLTPSTSDNSITLANVSGSVTPEFESDNLVLKKKLFSCSEESLENNIKDKPSSLRCKVSTSSQILSASSATKLANTQFSCHCSLGSRGCAPIFGKCQECQLPTMCLGDKIVEVKSKNIMTHLGEDLKDSSKIPLQTGVDAIADFREVKSNNTMIHLGEGLKDSSKILLQTGFDAIADFREENYQWSYYEKRPASAVAEWE
ncbi:G2/M phase-specific E3 ubiquitin-protein ligase-like isoform X2 [Hydractinia symbiolongicarpus]|uniref:G2/M phase-specific E3 ubiquitin-protein ligase-like isoform X2 n=1 Tax=Hydractinia symbiolongicarpus TaxID=13093 RepID=UPI0025505F3D|nr:G2/M phase-specific E3 ubiquitin-protein ligase-like isoform X2 [Hydractinia symbiolongicarpus]